MVSDSGMQALRIVELVDIPIQRPSQLFPITVSPAADQLGLQAVEERLHVGVVSAALRSIDRVPDSMAFERGLVPIGGVFDTAIRMKDLRSNPVATPNRIGQGLQCEIDSSRITQ